MLAACDLAARPLQTTPGSVSCGCVQLTREQALPFRFALKLLKRALATTHCPRRARFPSTERAMRSAAESSRKLDSDASRQGLPTRGFSIPESLSKFQLLSIMRKLSERRRVEARAVEY